jgi:hypothetical protein
MVRNRLAAVPGVRRTVYGSRRWWRIVKTLMRITDRKRWRDRGDPGYATGERNALIASLVPSRSAVLDLGAGTQQLRRFLPPGCEYQPCDLDGGNDVLDCDFNAGRFPAVARRYDILVVSGVLEFIHDPEAFLGRLPDYGDVLLVSYRFRSPWEPLRKRRASGYLSHLEPGELESTFDRLGYRWERVGLYEHVGGADAHTQPIYRVELVTVNDTTGSVSPPAPEPDGTTAPDDVLARR